MTRKMKKTIILAIFATLLASCAVDDRYNDLSASFSGRVVNSVSGDVIPTESFGAALLFGDEDRDATQPVTYYIRQDGSYNNTKVFPGKFTIWAKGPYCQIDTLHSYDLRGHCNFDLKVVPNVDIKLKDASVGTNATCKMDFEYKVNSESKMGDMVIVWSTVPFPGANEATVETDNFAYTTWMRKFTFSGEGASTNLRTTKLYSGKTYYVRVGMKVVGSDYWNYTPQVKVDATHVIEK